MLVSLCLGFHSSKSGLAQCERLHGCDAVMHCSRSQRMGQSLLWHALSWLPFKCINETKRDGPNKRLPSGHPLLLPPSLLPSTPSPFLSLSLPLSHTHTWLTLLPMPMASALVSVPATSRSFRVTALSWLPVLAISVSAEFHFSKFRVTWILLRRLPDIRVHEPRF